MTKLLALALSLILVIASLIAPVAAQQQQQWKPDIQHFKWAVATAGGDWFRAGAKFTTILPEALPGVSAGTLMGGGVVNVTKVGKKEAQMGFALTPYPEDGYNGRGKYKEAYKNLRLMASNLGRTVVIAGFVLKDSPIKTFADIKGKRIVPGDRGWGTTELVEAMMTAAGMPPDKFKADGGTISYTSITDRSKALQDRNVDAIFIPAQVTYPDLMVVQQAIGLRAIQIPPDLVDKTVATTPGAIKSSVPKGLYGVLEQEVPSPGFLQQIIADAALSDELVYRVTKLWWERIKEIREVAPTLDKADVRIAMEHATIPFHPGAIRYYKEVGVAR
ncbi:MAG: TAXI family TRAP transporter solute-binding subunit [Candidatus Rokubacteria bacterium]|nr:TAXI family TRAP transporter solute-binding subunit [Candidatus Rokubacteria bacterium]